MIRELASAENFDQSVFPESKTQLSLSNTDKFLSARNFLLENRTNYHKAYSEFEWPRFGNFNWAHDYFDKIPKNHRQALCIISERGEIKRSFAQMSERSNQVANYLVKNGVKPFDRIMLMLPNVVELWECMLAAIKIPAIIIPTATTLSPEDIRYRLKTANIQYVVTLSQEMEKFQSLSKTHKYQCFLIGEERDGCKAYKESEEFPKTFTSGYQTRATDPLLYYFTSGTTSQPKLVVHTHQSYPVGHLTTMYWLGLKPGSVHLNIATPGWAKHPWSAFFAPWNAEVCVFSYGYPRFDPDQFLNALVQYPVTSLCAPPTVWRVLRQKDLSKYRIHLKEVASAGEPLNPEVIADVKKAWGLDIREGYGQTETTALIGFSPGQKVIPGAMGYVQPGYRLALAQGQTISEEIKEGELVVELGNNPIGLMQGYQEEQKTADAIRNQRYHTGDILARSTKNPHTFFFIGRKDDVFKSSGYRISPFELESKLMEYPAIAEAAVVPSPHSTKGFVPKAFVVTKGKVSSHSELAKEIFSFLHDKLADSHRIRIIEFLDELPKNASGKILRRELALQEASSPQKQGHSLMKPAPLIFHETDRLNTKSSMITARL
jgi:acetyl-CoA synthetase